MYKVLSKCIQQLECGHNSDYIHIIHFIKKSFQGRFRVQAEMIHGHDIVGCFHVEMDIQRHGGGGFLFG